MPKKKGKTEPTWDEIGKIVGSKMEKGFKGKECCGPWYKWGNYHDNGGSGFFGRALFITGLLIALNGLGMLHGINIWILVLIGVGFALMSF